MKNLWKSVMVTGVVMAGCQLGVEQLEAGDDVSDATGDGDGQDGDGDGDGDGLDADACWAQGSNLGGAPDPLDFPLPECEVECATGWGHGAPSLAIAWTLDLEHEGATTGWTHLSKLPDGNLVASISREGSPARLVFVSPTGEQLADVEQLEITGDLWELAIDDSGTIYTIWTDLDIPMLTASSSAGEHLWTVELSADPASYSVLAPLDSGVVIALNPLFDPQSSQLLQVSANGTVTPMGPIPLSSEIAVSPDKSTIALATATSITWTDFNLFPNALVTQGVANMQLVLGLAALDDQRIAAVGVTTNDDEGGTTHAVIQQIGQTGLEWEGYYDRASSWCPQQSPTEETFIDVARLADGSTLVVGREWNAVDAPQDQQVQQPWVGHVSPTGEVLAIDRGFWRGEAVAAVGGDDGSAYALLYEFDDSNQQQLHLRKYSP